MVLLIFNDVWFKVKNSFKLFVLKVKNGFYLVDEKKLFKLYQELRMQGVYVNIVTYPAVRRKECRLRLCVMKDLTYKQLDKAIDLIIKKGKEYQII